MSISFNDHVAQALTGGNIAEVKGRLYDCLSQADLKRLHETLGALFASIAHTNYTRNRISVYEGYYASAVYAFFAGLGLDLTAEDVTSTGRMDLSVGTDKNIYLFEFKVDGGGGALPQIKDRQYHLKYRDRGKDIYLVGIDFDSAQRNIAGFEWEQVRS